VFHQPNQNINRGLLWLHEGRRIRFYAQMRLVRTFEQTLLDLFTRNELAGTTHTCIGQEANAVGIVNALDRERDMVWSNHRCHGHFLAYCGEVTGLMAEILGRATGVCGGRGGSQHLHWRNFSSSGVQAGFVPAAVGAAHAERCTGAIGCVFMGDGTMGEGLVYESLNMASLWSAPVLFVVEDNGIAQTTPAPLGLAGSITDRARPFGIRCEVYESTDADEIFEIATELVNYVRQESKPAWLHLKTVRLGPHSKGDDTRSEGELAALRARDPLLLYAPRVERAAEIDRECACIVQEALETAQKAPIACASWKI
jgi:acetoin:2,6-dichlorophenolindophenol oxidoreductase subunit alpha